MKPSGYFSSFLGTMDKKIADFIRFFGEKSDFGGVGKDFRMKKSEVKKLEKNY